MNLLARFLLLVAGLASIVFGVHGLIVYFSPLEMLFKDPQKLFLEIDVPSSFKSAVEWMSIKGFQSWVIPAVFVALGIGCWALQSQIKSSKG